MVASSLDRALRALSIPILGVSVGSEADRTTWRIDYAAVATAQHRIDGEALRNTFDPTNQAVLDADIAASAALGAAFKDRLADLALVASVTDAGWAAATPAQKVAKVRALAVTWQSLRAFVERNL